MKFILTTVFVFVTVVFAAHAQVAPQSTCKTRSFSFVCPSNTTVLSSGTKDGVFVGFENKAKVALFAKEIGDSADDDKSLNELLDVAFEALYETRYSEFKLKESKDFWGDQRYSRFEEKKYSKVALNNRTKELMHLHLAVVAFDGKRILAGFARTMMKGDGAEDRFNSWIGGGGSGDRELHDLLKAITKDDEARDIPGGPPPAKKPSAEIPGGPPPAKKP